ncbi:hypothetical protein B0H14DRAFT_3458428 [Mycena olivaceomarginata]|nr:hypothetical protein B0H14DRAFT_3458428 [Mycena olivaceomarginata]
MSSSTQRCVLPFHPDPGQPGQPVAHQKICLVSEPDCKKPGAYISWPSASAEYSKYSSASIKSYTEWELAQSACHRFYRGYTRPRLCCHSKIPVHAFGGDSQSLTISRAHYILILPPFAPPDSTT